MRNNKIASILALTFLTLSMKPILSSASITNNSIINNNENQTHSFNVEFKSVSTEEKAKEVINHENTIDKDTLSQYSSPNDETNQETDTDEGISFSNIDEEDTQILFIQETKFNDLNWQINVQRVDTDYVQLAEFMNNGYSVDKQVFPDGNNMLLLSAMQQREDLFNFALNNGANVKYINKEGQNAYHWASNGYNPILFKNLLDKNNSLEILNKSDNLGKTPLHFAAANGNLEILDLLLKNNVNIYINDKDGRSPLFYALVYGKYEAALVLIQKGADLTLVDKNGTSIEDLILNSNIDMFQMSYKYLPKDIQEKIIKILKNSPQIAYNLVNPNVTYEKIKEIEKNTIDVNEDFL